MNKDKPLKQILKYLKECKNFHHKLCKKHNTCEIIQNELLKDIPRKLDDAQNLFKKYKSQK